MTIYRATVLDTPESPFAGGTLRADDDAGILVAGRRDSSAAAPSRRSPAAHPTKRSSTCGAACSCPGSSTPTCTTPQVRVIGGLGMPLLEWLERCALPEEAPLADAHYARTVAAEFVTGLVRRERRPRSSSGRTSRQPWTRCSPSPPGSGCASRPASSSATGCSAPTCSRRRRGPTTRRRARRTLARPGPTRYAVTPRFSLSASEPMLESCASLPRTSKGPGSPRTSTRTATRSPRCAGCSRGTRLHRHLRPVRPGRAAQRPRPQRARARPGARAARRARARGSRTARQQLGPGQRPLPAAPAHRARRPGGPRAPTSARARGSRCFKEGLQAYFMQQLLEEDGLPLTSAHLLYLATARRRGRPGPRRRGRRPVGGQAVRRGLGAPAGRQHRSMSPSATPRTPTTPWPRSSRWPARPTSRGVGGGRLRPLTRRSALVIV